MDFAIFKKYELPSGKEGFIFGWKYIFVQKSMLKGASEASKSKAHDRISDNSASERKTTNCFN